MNKLILPYLHMPKAQVICLLNLDFEKLFKIKRNFREEWIKKKKCSCTSNIQILRNKIRLNCNHIEKEMEEKTKEINKEINKKSSILMYRNLRKVK